MEEGQGVLQRAEKLFDQKQFDEAERLVPQLPADGPTAARVFQLRGLLHSERHRPVEAVELLKQAVSLQPDLAPSHNGLGLCYYQLDDLDRALYHFDRALILSPTHANSHFNRALVWLKRGQYAEGWVEYEWRWPSGMVKRPQIPRPLWDGSPLNGRRLLIHTEQGIGDVLQFIRLLPLVCQRGGRLVMACQKSLHVLLKSLPWVEEWFPIDQPTSVNFDLYAPLLSLPALLGLTLDELPREVPYLSPDPDRVRLWERRAADLPGLKVGICWQGSVTFRGDHNRSIPLEEFRALGDVAGLSLVSLQKSAGVDQIAAHRDALRLTVFDDLDADAAFVDTAALMQHLDLIISSDTAVAHLAGALGRPVWVLLGTGADWRWMEHRTDSPWYPTARLIRQRSPRDWKGVFTEVATELRLIATGGAVLPIGVAREVEALTPEQPTEPGPPVSPQSEASNMSATPAADSIDENKQHPLGELASVHTSNFPGLLRQLNVSLAVTTYQAGRLIFLRPEGDVLNTHFRAFDRPMGLAYRNGHMAIGCGIQVWEFFNVPAVAAKVEPAGTHDACFMPRRSHFTGDIDVHEMAFGTDESLWLINTRFCCLCNLDLRSSFIPRWRPPFITRLVPEDRCHLNGLALVDGMPRYVTALGTADTAEGWRANKARGGVLMDVTSNRVLLEGLSMPHSPRWYRDRLWLLESGDGSLGWVDLTARKYHKICELPGFTRGVDFVGPLAFVGLSQVRESAIFSGIPLGERLKERICGIYVVNIETGSMVAFLNFTSGVQEVFAVQALTGLRYPELVNENNDFLRHTYVLPEQVLSEAGVAGATPA